MGNTRATFVPCRRAASASDSKASGPVPGFPASALASPGSVREADADATKPGTPEPP